MPLIAALLNISLPLHQTGQAASLVLVRNRVLQMQRRGVGAGRIFERKHSVIFDGIQQPKGLMKIVLSLSGKAHNNVGCQADLAAGRFDPCNAFQVLFAGVETLHGIEYPGRAALHGKVHMIAEGRHGVDYVNDILAEVTRMRGGKAHPLHARNLSHSGQQFGERLLPCRILIRIYVLAQQLDFAVAQVGHLTSFRQDRIGGAAPLFAAGVGHDAVRAKFVAAFNDGDVPAMRVGTGSELGFKALVGLAIVEAGDVAVPGLDLYQHLRKITVRRRAAHHGDVRSAVEDLFPFLLGDAPENAEDLSLLLIFLVVREPVKDLLLGFVTNRAGIVEDQVGFLHGLYLAIAFGDERADDLFRVMHVHLAAEGLEVKLLVSAVSHPASV